ncbi:P-loop containing nucleoside triphosphate hydrolases superfamily protein [Striga hermonthica]|uniref:P-loop containing nucleoside triphosphate hydrolases superfamily protein n=1 Tax=Striga hermonthica TaxID=68872 RepID=A0A9N7RK31_STRHE|nr:P-loop containing nucleoside triphosphate hydrolases superfamily protein [Striga hermonthica]
MEYIEDIPSTASSFLSAYASMAGSIMLFRSIANDVVPDSLHSFFHSTFEPYARRLLDRLLLLVGKRKRVTLVVDENAGIFPNLMYTAAETYLQTKIPPDSDRLRVVKTSKRKSISVGIVRGQRVTDRFAGFDLTWRSLVATPQSDREPRRRYFELSFEAPNKETVVEEYLLFVLSRAEEIRAKDRRVKLYTIGSTFDDGDDDGDEVAGGGSMAGKWCWGCVDLDHPATFERLAMDPDLKRALVEDLDRFVRRKDYYRSVGKTWRRGYLLHGPPGTGKSSLVAAIANYLKFDVYDLELASLYSNSQLKGQLLSTNNRSIIVIEYVDCSTQMHSRDGDSDDDKPRDGLTLSGMLNFIDGLWSSCGDERIIIFTTNHKEKLDPALIRPGRMDMQIHMGYCTPQGFDVLASNYLRINDHPTFSEIKELIREVEITPAEIAEYLMRNEDTDLALEGVLDLLKQKKEEKNVEIKESETKKNKVCGCSDGGESKGKKKRKGKLGANVGSKKQRLP